MKKIRLKLWVVYFFVVEFVQKRWEQVRQSYTSEFLVAPPDQFIIKDCYFVIDPSMERGITIIGWPLKPGDSIVVNASEEISSS